MQASVISTFLLVFCSTCLIAQAPVGDCLGAIPICQPIYEETESPVGFGNSVEINGTFNCMVVESNSVWYTFTVNESGNFGFVLTPNNLDDDYDWALFDITNANCEDLANDPELIVSCNAAGGTGCTGATGATGATPFNDQGFNCGQNPPNNNQGFSPFNDLVPVEAGNTYVLCVSNWTGSPNGYTLDFSLSEEIAIFDEMAPSIDAIVLPEDCNEEEVSFVFTEFVQCATVEDSNFSLTGPGGPFTVSLSSVNCDAGGNFAKEFMLNINPPLTTTGTYQLNMEVNGNDEVLDLCDNPAVSQAFTFSIADVIVPADLGPDQVLCEGGTLLLDVTADGVTYEWQDGSTGPTFEVSEAGVYWVRISNDCGSNIDSIEIVIQPPLSELDLGDDMTLCPGETLTLDATTEGATYEWQDGSTSATFLVETPGAFAVTISTPCETQTDQVEVDYFPAITASFQNASLCIGETLVLDATTSGATYLWQDGSTNPTFSVNQAGDYAVTITTACETDVLSASIEVVEEPPAIELGPDTSLCNGETLVFDLGIPGASYLWQDGSDNSDYTISQSGDYGVTVSNGCGEVTDALSVEVFEPLSVSLGRDTFLCPGVNLLLDATHPSATFYQWQDNSVEPTFAVRTAGAVSVVVGNDCETVSAQLEVLECEVCDVYVPNAFSPNDDGVNDEFLPLSDCILEAYDLKVFDRWGSIVFETDDPETGWDGDIRSKTPGLGVYVWMMTFTVIENNQPRTVSLSGDVLVLR